MELEALLAGLAPARGRSWAAHWHEDHRTLVGVSRRGYGHLSLELLASGLPGLSGRDLRLVVPRAAVKPTRARAAFLTATVHVHQSLAAGVADAEPRMSQPDATDFYRRLGQVSEPVGWDAASWPTWLKELVDWVESRRVERVRNTEFHAWHYRGRQVLSVRRTAADGYKLIAGVDYRTPTEDRPPPVRLHVLATEALTTDQAAGVRSAVDRAIERRRTGDDNTHREHLLQAAIGTDPALIGMSHLRRELPAWRPKQKPYRGRAYIDFLGRDVDRTGHVIETKIGPDAQLGIQTLDYWTWANAHRAELAGHIDADPDRPFQLDIVLDHATEPLLHPAAAATLEAFGPEVDWRCHLVTEWDTITMPQQLLTPEAEALRPRQLPD